MNRFRRQLGLWHSMAAVVLLSPIVGVAATGPDLGELTHLTVFPAEIHLTGADPVHRLLVTATTKAGRQIDLTHTASYVSSTKDIAAISSDGVIQGLKDGEANITVTVGQQTATTKVRVKLPPADRQVSFINDVMPVISKAGCNSGSCHAKQNGQAGFQLSVFGYDPQSDYNAIIKGARGRRVVLAAPEESLFIKKPMARVKHGGGLRYETGSKPYQTFMKWLGQGAPYSSDDEAELVHVDVYPDQRLYDPQAKQQLLIVAEYSDGTHRDVTHLAEFHVNDEEIASVNETGLLAIGPNTGETIIITRFMGHAAVSRVVIPVAGNIPDAQYAALPRNNFVDELAYPKHQELGMLPSKRCTDAEFIRRASLDAIGTMPTPEQTRAFLADQDPDKRNKLIDRILQHPYYGDHWALKWGDLIRSNPVRVGVKGVFMFDHWIRQSFHQNKPYDQFAREILTAKGSAHQYGPTVLYRDRRSPDEIASMVSQIFLGTRIECAKCHHHPNEKISQTDFYQLAAFFGQLKRKGPGISTPISPGEEFFYHAPGGGVRHPVTGKMMDPAPLFGDPVQLAGDQDPREGLVKWLLEPDNPYFARAIVNRIWASFMGKGFVEPVDDFRISNPPTNPALLDALAKDFVDHRYDLKHLMRTIMRSHIYQLSSEPNETNVRDQRNYARSYRRRLPAEVMLDAIDDITAISTYFSGMPPGTRAIQTWNFHLGSFFMDAFSRPDRSQDPPCDREESASIVQALHLMNSPDLQKKIADKKGRPATLAATDKTPAQIIEELYLFTYCRYPDEEEVKIASAAYAAPGATRQTATEDVLWALLNSAEFVFNH